MISLTVKPESFSEIVSPLLNLNKHSNKENMKKTNLSRPFPAMFWMSAILSFFPGFELLAQNGNGSDKEFTIVVSCTEYIGNGKILAHFGYENPGKKTISVDENGSVVTYNRGQSKKNGLAVFEPGVKEKAFSQEFDAQDRVQWTVTLPNGKVKTADADINSNHCRDVEASLDIIPGYQPPEGGKQYDSKIGAELTSLYNAYSYDPDNFAGATDAIFQLDGQRVLIEVVAYNGMYADLMSSLSALGFTVVTEDAPLDRATGWIDIGNLLQLNGFAALDYARPVYPGVSNYTVPPTGLTNSQGDKAMHSDFARLGFDINGAGVKIGVLSNSYDTKNKAAQDVVNGDLPGAGNPNGYLSDVHVLKDLSANYGVHSDEGRAMLQIVHDIAPGAELAFRTGYLGEQDMADGIRELADAGCDVIVDDLSYITEPFFRDGVITGAIDEVVAGGVTFFSSAGNFGRASYTGTFIPAAAPSTINGLAHDFSGTGDIFQAVSLPEGDYTLVMQWDDGSHPGMLTTQTDLDIFLSDDVGFALLGFNRENVGGYPIEVVPFSVSGDTVESNIVVARASGPDVPVTFKYILFRGGSLFTMLEYDQGNSTIVGHPNASGAISVGAVRYDKNPVYSPGLYEKPVIMSFSSLGGTPVDGVVRSKPDITAPNGVNTTVDLGNGDWDGDTDTHPNFFGTSAASPHAAAVAALILEAKARFDAGNPIDPEGIRTLLKTTAIDMDAPGDDLVSGSGFIQAHRALMTFANPTPHIENLILAAEGGVPGEEITPVSFTVTGDFFTGDTEIWFRGESLDTGVVVQDQHTISVEHPGFLGNPSVKAYTPTISSSGLDGGFSETSYFSDPVKQRVYIQATDAAKKYGEQLPALGSVAWIITQEGDSLSLEEAVSAGRMLQAEADRLSVHAIQTPASALSDAGEYLLAPVLDPALDPGSPATELDLAITEKYILEYRNGVLRVEKLGLKITPADLELVYGMPLPAEGISFDYAISDSTVLIEDLSQVLANVASEHSTALSNEISLVRGVALVNGIPVIRGAALVNGVTMIRGTALVNGTEVSVEINGADTTVWVGGEVLTSGSQLIRGLALVNGLPFINAGSILRGVALVNQNEVAFENGYMTALNGVPLTSGVPAVRGLALVNGEALVDGQRILADGGVTTIDGQAVPGEGIVVQNGITLIRGTALVNSGNFIRGKALVNDLEVPIENGIPQVRGLALVNGIPMLRGTALVNNLEVDVFDGEITEVREDGSVVNGIILENGVGFIRGTALVNGSSLLRGTALVNGLALPDDSGFSDDVVDLEDMNLMASQTALANGSLPGIRGLALVNGLEGLDGQALKVAAGTPQPDGSVVYENAGLIRGLALVNAFNYIRGTALVNNEVLPSEGAIVNSSDINENSNRGTILVFDATDLSAEPEDLGFDPISFITGTTAGRHWIVPGTYISNNFEITYGLGTLTIHPAGVEVMADPKQKTYGDTDPDLSYQSPGLYGSDQFTGNLEREEGEDAATYKILQGSLDAGDNYQIEFTPASFTILPAVLSISATAEDKVYDGNPLAMVTLSDDRLSGDSLEYTVSAALFADKNVGTDKAVSVEFTIAGPDAGNYSYVTGVETTASITPASLILGVTAEDKVYDGTRDALTSGFVREGLVLGDEILVQTANGLFADPDVGTEKPVTAQLSISGADALNYLFNAEADTVADILPRELNVVPLVEFRYINEGDPLPEFEFSFNGLVPGDLISLDYSVLRDSDGVPYDPAWDESAGTYTVTPLPENVNYIFQVESATLHVNPYGPGTRAIRPVLNCIEEIGPGLYIANFEYENRNDAAVYVPIGPDNLLSGSGINWGASDPQPVMFVPGGAGFVVYFDGSELSWSVSSLEEDHKVSNAANANSSSTKCKNSSFKSAAAGNTDEELIVAPEKLHAYPNPGSGTLYLDLAGIEDYRIIELVDMTGRSHPVLSVKSRTNQLELDLSHLAAGTYFLRVVTDEHSGFVQVIRQ